VNPAGLFCVEPKIPEVEVDKLNKLVEGKVVVVLVVPNAGCAPLNKPPLLKLVFAGVVVVVLNKLVPNCEDC